MLTSKMELIELFDDIFIHSQYKDKILDSPNGFRGSQISYFNTPKSKKHTSVNNLAEVLSDCDNLLMALKKGTQQVDDFATIIDKIQKSLPDVVLYLDSRPKQPQRLLNFVYPVV